MEYPYYVAISSEHDGKEVLDWLTENGIRHQEDYKALRMRHRGIYALYFKDSRKAVMTKLRWSGV
jgi:hypothetical protein